MEDADVSATSCGSARALIVPSATPVRWRPREGAISVFGSLVSGFSVTPRETYIPNDLESP